MPKELFLVFTLALGLCLGAGAASGQTVLFDGSNLQVTNIPDGGTVTVNGPATMNNIQDPTSAPIDFIGGNADITLNTGTGAITVDSINALPAIDANQSNVTVDLVEATIPSGNSIRFGPGGMLNGTHAPGGTAIGTHTVDGVYTLGAGAILQVEVDENGQSDQVIVNGTVDITGATLDILDLPGTFATPVFYTLIQNDGTDPVTGTFGAIIDRLPLLSVTVSTTGGDGNDVVLAIPEPPTALVQLAALVALAATRARRWRLLPMRATD